MRQKRMGIGAIKTSLGGIGPMCQKGTFRETPHDAFFSFARYEDAVVLKNHLNN